MKYDSICQYIAVNIYIYIYTVDLLDHMPVLHKCYGNDGLFAMSECIKYLDNTTITISFIYIEILCNWYF